MTLISGNNSLIKPLGKGRAIDQEKLGTVDFKIIGHKGSYRDEQAFVLGFGECQGAFAGHPPPRQLWVRWDRMEFPKHHLGNQGLQFEGPTLGKFYLRSEGQDDGVGKDDIVGVYIFGDLIHMGGDLLALVTSRSPSLFCA